MNLFYPEIYGYEYENDSRQCSRNFPPEHVNRNGFHYERLIPTFSRERIWNLRWIVAYVCNRIRDVFITLIKFRAYAYMYILTQLIYYR